MSRFIQVIGNKFLKNLISYQIKGLNELDKNSLRLFLFFSQTQFSFSIKKDHELCALFSWEYELNTESELFDTIRNESLLKGDFLSVQLIFDSAHQVLIPAEFFNELDESKYLGVSWEIAQNEVVKSYLLDDINAHIIYSFPESIFYWVKSRFFDASILNASALFIQKALQHERKDGFYVRNGKSFIQIVVKDNNKLVYNNCFKINNKEELLYFIASISKQHGRAQNESSIDLAAFSFEEYQFLKSYFAFVYFIETPDIENLEQVLGQSQFLIL